MNRYFLWLLMLYAMPNDSSLLAQIADSEVTNSHSFFLKTQFSQVKDDLTFGLVYRGANLIVGYSFDKRSSSHRFTYDGALGFGASFNKGVGLAWRFTPVDIFYGYKVGTGSVTLGPYIRADYNWQQYSELQGGRLFWLTAMHLGPKATVHFPIGAKSVEVSFSYSLAGLTSRPEPTTESYFYDFSFSEFFSSAHRNLKFGSMGLFSQTNLEIKWQAKNDKKLYIGYELEYLGYYKSPEVSYLNHSINLIWRLGSS